MFRTDNRPRKAAGRTLGDRLTLYGYGLIAILGVIVGFVEMTENLGYGLILVVVIGAGLASCASAIGEDLARDIRSLSHRANRSHRLQ